MIINKTQLNAIKFASPDENRANLNALRIMPEQNAVEATSGHFMVRVTTLSPLPVEDFPDTGRSITPIKKEVLIPKDAIEKVIKNFPKTDKFMPILNNVFIGENKEKVEFTSTDLETSQTIGTRQVAGKFPSTERVWEPARKNSIKICFNASLMRQICDFMQIAMKGNPDLPVTLAFDENAPNESAFYLTCESDENKIEACLMPVRM